MTARVYRYSYRSSRATNLLDQEEGWAERDLLIAIVDQAVRDALAKTCAPHSKQTADRPSRQNRREARQFIASGELETVLDYLTEDVDFFATFIREKVRNERVRL